MIPEEPKEFRELCEKVGLALIMGQKVQFALAYYYSVYHLVNSGWNSEQVKAKVDFHLSRPMGVVVSAIEKDAPLEASLYDELVQFKAKRNWLVHDFDEESTQYLTQGDKYQHYLKIMDDFINDAETLMVRLHVVGQSLVPVGI